MVFRFGNITLDVLNEDDNILWELTNHTTRQRINGHYSWFLENNEQVFVIILMLSIRSTIESNHFDLTDHLLLNHSGSMVLGNEPNYSSVLRVI